MYVSVSFFVAHITYATKITINTYANLLSQVDNAMEHMRINSLSSMVALVDRIYGWQTKVY